MTKRGWLLLVLGLITVAQQRMPAQTVSSPVIVFSYEDVRNKVLDDMSPEPGIDRGVIDISLGTISSGSQRYWFSSFWDSEPNPGGIWFSKTRGGLERPLANSVWKMRSQLELFPNSLPTDGTFWIASVYQHPGPEGGILAFLHIENVEQPAPCSSTNRCSRVGLAWSSNGGESFTYLGNIIRANPEAPNVQGIPFAVKDGYFYVYYHDSQDIPGGAGCCMAAARAPVSEVIAQAKLGQTSQWLKSYDPPDPVFPPGFVSNGLGGPASLLPNNLPFGISHTNAAYSTYTGKIYLATTMHTGWYLDQSGQLQHIDGPSWIDLYESSDGIAFTKILRLDERSDPEVFFGFQYISFVDENGAGNGVVGQRFHVYGLYEIGEPGTQDPYTFHETGLRWTVDLGPPTDFFRLSTDYSLTQGLKNWFYKYVSSNAFLNMTWNGTAWQGNDANLLLWPTGGHPGPTGDTALEWKAPHAGVVMVAGIVTDANRGCGDGVTATIELNGNQQPLTGTTLWKGTIENGDTVGVSHHLALRVETNDVLRFLMNPRGTNYCDSTRWDPTVAFVNDSWLYSTGFSSSHNLNRWSYHDSQSADLTYDAVQTWWKGSDSGGYPVLGQGWSHPGSTKDAVLKWSAPYAGTVRITGAVDVQTGCGDGVAVTIAKGTTSLWSVAIDEPSPAVSHNVAIEVTPGDELTFVTNRRGNYFCDSTAWNPKVEYVTAWRASAGYSPVQGLSRWRYESSTGPSSMTYNTGTTWWRGTEESGAYPILGASMAHPGPGADAILKWVAPRVGSVRIAGRAYDGGVGCGDGVVVSIKQGGTTVWGPTTITEGDTTGLAHEISITVAANEEISFITNRGSLNHFCDATVWDPLIWYQ